MTVEREVFGHFRFHQHINKWAFKSDLKVFHSLGIDFRMDAHAVFEAIEIMKSVQSRTKED